MHSQHFGSALTYLWDIGYAIRVKFQREKFIVLLWHKFLFSKSFWTRIIYQLKEIEIIFILGYARHLITEFEPSYWWTHLKCAEKYDYIRCILIFIWHNDWWNYDRIRNCIKYLSSKIGFYLHFSLVFCVCVCNYFFFPGNWKSLLQPKWEVQFQMCTYYQLLCWFNLADIREVWRIFIGLNHKRKTEMFFLPPDRTSRICHNLHHHYQLFCSLIFFLPFFEVFFDFYSRSSLIALADCLMFRIQTFQYAQKKRKQNEKYKKIQFIGIEVAVNAIPTVRQTKILQFNWLH